MSQEINIEIKNRFMGSVLFAYSIKDNTLAQTLIEAVRHDADLYEANLRRANLREANLYGADLCKANLCGANLREADLSGADLCKANLCGANLCGANLYEANLRRANLREANLYGANLSGADLRGANLREANLCGADLYGADLREADLYGANLCRANLCEANLCEAKGGYLACPSEGSFIGWKKASGYIVKLRISEDSHRSSAGGEKCRCDKAFVVEIQNPDGSKADVRTVHSDYTDSFIYTVGATVEVPDFEEDRWNECAPGIHFFIDRRAAVEH